MQCSTQFLPSVIGREIGFESFFFTVIFSSSQQVFFSFGAAVYSFCSNFFYLSPDRRLFHGSIYVIEFVVKSSLAGMHFPSCILRHILQDLPQHLRSDHRKRVS